MPEFAPTSTIIESQLKSSAGPVSEAQVKILAEKIFIGAERLAPNENLTLSLLVRGPGTAPPTVGVRSNEAIGRQIYNIFSPSHEETNNNSFLASATVVIIQILLLLFIITRAGRILDSVGSANDSSFVLIHKRILRESMVMLSEKMKRRGCSVFEMTNFGLAAGLSGDMEVAEKYQEAAHWWAWSKKTKSLIFFNQAILAFQRKEFDLGCSKLAESFRLNPRTIIKYAAYSDYILEAQAADPSVSEIINKHRKAFQLSP